MKAIRRILVLTAVVAVGTGFLLMAPIGATGEPSQHIVKVTKIVEDDPGDVSGVIDVCGQSLNWDEDGLNGVEVVIGDYYDGDQTCVVSEPDDGGASSVEIDGSPCSFTGKSVESIETTDATTVYPDQICVVTIENSFDTPPTTTPETVIVQPPPEVIVVPGPPVAIIRSPQFTG